MNYELIKNTILKKYETEASQKPEEIYSQGKSSDSPRSFRHQRTRKINSRTLSKIF